MQSNRDISAMTNRGKNIFRPIFQSKQQLPLYNSSLLQPQREHQHGDNKRLQAPDQETLAPGHITNFPTGPLYPAGTCAFRAHASPRPVSGWQRDAVQGGMETGDRVT